VSNTCNYINHSRFTATHIVPSAGMTRKFEKLKLFRKSLSSLLRQWYPTFFVRVPPEVVSLQFCTPKVVGV
jgi:hypothetical protein